MADKIEVEGEVEGQGMVAEFSAAKDYAAAGLPTGEAPVEDKPKEPEEKAPEEKPEGKQDEKVAKRVPLHEAEKIPAIEKVAAEWGWLPEKSYTPKLDRDGKPRPWVSAEEFIRNVRQVNKIDENEHLRKDIKDIKKTVGEYKVFSDKAHAAELAKLKKQLEERRSDAIRDMDEPLVDEIDKEISDVDVESAKVDDAAQAEKAKAEDQAAVKTWQEEHAWYEDDAQLAIYADRYAENARAKMPDAPFSEILVIVDEKMTKHLPGTEEPAADPPPKKAAQKLSVPSVEAGAVNASGDDQQAGSISYSDLPKQAQEMCDRFVAMTPGFTRQDYLKGYQSQG